MPRLVALILTAAGRANANKALLEFVLGGHRGSLASWQLHLPAAIGFGILCVCGWLTEAQQQGTRIVMVIAFCLVIALSTVCLEDSCSSPAAYTTTISQVSASYVWQGYVFMFFALSMSAYIVIERLDFMQMWRIYHTGVLEMGLISKLFRFRAYKLVADAVRRDGPEQKGSARHSVTTGKVMAGEVTCYELVRLAAQALVRLGCSLTVLTGVLPDFVTNCALQPNSTYCSGMEIMHVLHLAGVQGGTMLTLLGVVAETAMICREKRARGWRLCAAAALIFAASAVCFGFAVAFVSVKGTVSKPLIHGCINYENEHACEGAPEYVPARWFNLSFDLEPWPCVWLGATADVAESACQDPHCKDGGRLYNNQCSIIYEFHTLFFWLVSVSCYLFVVQKVELWDEFCRKGPDGGGRGTAARSTASGGSAKLSENELV